MVCVVSAYFHHPCTCLILCFWVQNIPMQTQQQHYNVVDLSITVRFSVMRLCCLNCGVLLHHLHLYGVCVFSPFSPFLGGRILWRFSTQRSLRLTTSMHHWSQSCRYTSLNHQVSNFSWFCLIIDKHPHPRITHCEWCNLLTIKNKTVFAMFTSKLTTRTMYKQHKLSL